MLTTEGRVLALWVLFVLTLVFIAVTYRANMHAALRLVDEQRSASDACEYITVEFLEASDARYPGGWHWRVECPDGSTFHVRVPRP